MCFLNRTRLLAALCCLCFFQVTGYCTSYFYSGPVSGYVSVELTPNGKGLGGLQVVFGTLTETLIYDPVARTLQEVGYVTISPSAATFDILQIWPNPNPGVVGSATLVVGENNRISFDRTIVFDGSVMNGRSELEAPVSGYGIYNGTAFSESWNVDVDITTTIIAASPTSLTFNERESAPYFYGKHVIPGTDLATGNYDGVYYLGWRLNSAVAQAIPVSDEHSTGIAISGAMMLGFVAFRRWKNTVV